MQREYLHELVDWPQFTWDSPGLAPILSSVRLHEGILLGKMKAYGFSTRQETTLKTLTEETLKTSAIEGEVLDPDSVRSSIARRLHLRVAGLSAKEDHQVEGIVEMMLDATQKYKQPLTANRLFEWHTHLFPDVRTSSDKFRVGAWRDDRDGPLQVISGPIGKEKVHYVAPSADRVPKEMDQFLKWFNGDAEPDPLLKAAIAHFWFVSIHPFEDGNGRIARALAEMCLARSDQSAQRFYSMSSQILDERKEYYRVLETSQRVASGLDITKWLHWFLECLDRAIHKAEQLSEEALTKESFWRRLKDQRITVNSRQRKILNKLFTDFEGKLTRSKWVKMTKCAPSTAQLDIQELVAAGVLAQDSAGGRSTSYSLRFTR